MLSGTVSDRGPIESNVRW